MIDTDKYEGHTPVRKKWPRWCEDWLFSLYSGKTEDGSHTPNWNQDNNLACDAPLILEAYKRLREEIKDYDACLQNLWNNELIPDDTDIWDEVKELLEVD
tara:strand:+ start:9835 stop:10134 length:300 start_codon:yes stop_codon:yes gene_type:complete